MPEHIDKIEIRSDEVQEVLNHIPSWMIRWGSVVILSLIILLLILSWVIKYPDVINTEAILTTGIPPQKEYAKVTGKIDTIFVSNNQNIEKETPLAILENTANYRDVFLLKSIIDKIKLNKKSFYFPIDSLPILFLGDIESDYATFENSYNQYILNRDLQPFSNEIIANKLSLSELQNRLHNLESQKKLNEKELLFSKKDLERNKILYDKKIISEQDYESKQLDYLQSTRNFKSLTISISQIREAIGNRSKILTGSNITKTKEELNLLKTTIQSFLKLKKSVKDWETRYLLKSEINGKVSFFEYWSANQTVQVGDLVFTIISDDDNYIGKLKASSKNIGKAEVNQEVQIRLQNYPPNEYGVLKGTVENISATANEDGFYLIDVSIPQRLITSYGTEIEFKQEMKGTANIITKDLRLIERLFYQFRDVFNR